MEEDWRESMEVHTANVFVNEKTESARAIQNYSIDRSDWMQCNTVSPGPGIGLEERG